MNAAIYARKSTAQKGKADTAKSVPQQIDGARDFIASKGWTLDDAHIYSDDEISGAEFTNRPGFQRLMAAALQPQPPFQVLIVRELSRLGREASEMAWTIKQLAVSGVEIFDVQGQSLTPKNWRDKALSGMQAAADEAHREASSIAVHGAHTRLHLAGHVVGGRVFGYRNKKIYDGVDRDGEPLYSHVERVINPEEAAVVRRIYELYADHGLGLKRIAKLLTAEGAPEPQHVSSNGLAPVTGWAPSTVRGVLTRETYRGVVLWNKTRKKNEWGQYAPTDRPPSDWLRATNRELIIVDDALWQRVAARRAEVEGKAVRFESGRLSGRPPKHATVNLLAGLATCGVCGGGLVVETGGKKRGRHPEYVCNRRRNLGTCANALRIPVSDMNDAVLVAIEEHALTPEAIEQVILLAAHDDTEDARAGLARERADVEKRIDRLVTAIETGGDVASLVAKLRELEARRTAIDREGRDLRPVPRLEQVVIENRLAEWRRLLRASTTQGRTVIQRIIRGRIVFTPHVNAVSGEVDGYEFVAPTRFDKLFTGIAVERPKSLERGHAGCEDIGPEDTFDADYGRLLETAIARKGKRARRESNPRPTGSKPAALSS